MEWQIRVNGQEIPQRIKRGRFVFEPASFSHILSILFNQAERWNCLLLLFKDIIRSFLLFSLKCIKCNKRTLCASDSDRHHHYSVFPFCIIITTTTEYKDNEWVIMMLLGTICTVCCGRSHFSPFLFQGWMKLMDCQCEVVIVTHTHMRKWKNICS